MIDFVWILIFLIGVMVLVIIWALICDNNKMKLQKRRLAEIEAAATVGNIYEFYGYSGNGDPFKNEKYRIVVLATIDDWVKYSEEIYPPESGKASFTGKNSAPKQEFYNWLSSRNAKQIKFE